jgi:hypothetical protein
MRSILLVKFFSLALMTFATSCRTWHEAKFNHGAGIAGDPVLVVPFSEPKQSLWYCESENGKVVSEAFKAWARENASEANFPEGESVEQVFRLVMNWQEKKITSAQWKTLTAGLGVKYVLCGEIENLSLTKPGRIGLLDPTVAATYRVINVETGSLAFGPPQLLIDYARGGEIEIPQADLGEDTSVAKRKLIVKLGAQIGKDLYGYHEE